MADKVELIRTLRTAEDEDERCFAAEDLIAFGDDPEVTAALVDALTNSSSRPVQEVACASLISIDNEDVIRRIAGLMGCVDAYVRNVASDILAEATEVPDALFFEMIKSEDPDMRIFTVVTVGNRRVRTLLPLVVEVLFNDKEVNVVAAAIDVIGNLGCRSDRSEPDRSDIRALKAAAQRFQNVPYITFAVADAIDKLEG
ncbi:MAG TPA: HEAT repeat domain-containing protein, partial [Gammaproteobacteria bacterium]|nr:HEAT repeat domain-containing protein [Gammaproteobacteria bacterium]